MRTMRFSVLLALLAQFSGIAPTVAETSSTFGIMEECTSEIANCTANPDCGQCLTELASIDPSALDITTTDTEDCTATYTTLCSLVVNEYGCNGTDPYLNDLAGCIANAVVSGCDSMESCADYATTSTPTQAPSHLHHTPMPSTMGPSDAPTASPTGTETMMDDDDAPLPDDSLTPTPAPLASAGSTQRSSWVTVISSLGAASAALLLLGA